MQEEFIMEEKLDLTQEWDKTFPKSDMYDMSRVNAQGYFDVGNTAEARYGNW